MTRVTETQESTYYAWKEVVKDEAGETHYDTPWSDPMLYESPFDFTFDSVEEAQNLLKDYFDDDESGEHQQWVLCKIYRKLEVLDLTSDDEPQTEASVGKSFASWVLGTLEERIDAESPS